LRANTQLSLLGGIHVNDLVPLFRRYRAPLAIGFDVCAWVVAYIVFAWLRFEGHASHVPWPEVVAVGLATALVYVAIGGALRLHQGRAYTASIEEMVLLSTITMSSGFLVFVVNLATQWVPRSVPAGATLATLVLAAWARATWRRLREREDEGHFEARLASSSWAPARPVASFSGRCCATPPAPGSRSGGSMTTPTSDTAGCGKSR
jgi:hypothetical protein